MELALLLLQQGGNRDWMAVGGNQGEKRRPQLQAELQVIFSCCCGGGSQGAVAAALNMFWPVEVSSPVMDQAHRELGSSVTGLQHTAAGGLLSLG